MILRYKNACSMRDVELRFEKGRLYIITGGNNSGKSSIFYTLSSSLLNSRETSSYINNEAVKENSNATMEVSIEDDTGSVYEFHRPAGSSGFYVINGKTFTKINKNNIFNYIDKPIDSILYDPDDIHKIVNIQGEDNGLFPFDRSNTEQFKLFERIFNITHSTKIFASIALDESDVKSKINDNLKAISLYENKIKSFDSILDVVKPEDILIQLNKFAELININNSICTDVNTYESLSNLIDNLDKLLLIDFAYDIKDINQLDKDIALVNNIQCTLDASKELCLYVSVDVEGMYKCIDDCNECIAINNEYEILRSELHECTNKFNEVSKELQNMKVCPLCGSIKQETL